MVASISTDRDGATDSLRLTLTHHPDGVESNGSGIGVVYDVDNNEAHYGAASVDGPALQWELHQGAAFPDALLSAEVSLDPDQTWFLRCDRIDFP
ncbi:MAG: hypothetical protein ACR2N7_01315, partial [Acidimicrobiia bacterium]